MIGMQKYIDNVFCIVLLYCFQIQRNSVRRFEKLSDHTMNYSSVSENKFLALNPTLNQKHKTGNTEMNHGLILNLVENSQ